MLPNRLSEDQVESLKKRTEDVLTRFNPAEHPLTVFTTGPDQTMMDMYFLDSADKTSYFMEEDAVVDGHLTVPVHDAVNKIGHRLHADPVFANVTEDARTLDLLRSLGYRRPVFLQSMLIFKQPRIGGKGRDLSAPEEFIPSCSFTPRGFHLSLHRA